jgi:hypothetical protein
MARPPSQMGPLPPSPVSDGRYAPILATRRASPPAVWRVSPAWRIPRADSDSSLLPVRSINEGTGRDKATHRSVGGAPVAAATALRGKDNPCDRLRTLPSPALEFSRGWPFPGGVCGANQRSFRRFCEGVQGRLCEAFRNNLLARPSCRPCSSRNDARQTSGGETSMERSGLLPGKGRSPKRVSCAIDTKKVSRIFV